MNFNLIEIVAILMFFIGFYGLITSRKMIKSIVLTVILEASVILFFLSISYGIGFSIGFSTGFSIGFRSEILPPIGAHFEHFERFADPLPQALMITAIIIGAAVTTIKITMVMTFFRKYKTTDWEHARKIRREAVED